MIWRIGLLNVADCDAVPASACAPQLTATLFPASTFPHHTVSLVVLTACLLLCLFFGSATRSSQGSAGTSWFLALIIKALITF